MRTTLRFLGCLCSIAAAGCFLSWFMGEGNPLLAPALFLLAVVLFSLAVVLDRLAQIELLLKSSHVSQTDRVKTDVGDFERLGNVEGQAMCLGCRRTAPKAGLYYNQTTNVYYHPECLARDRAGG